MSGKLKKVILCKGVTRNNDLQDSYKITLQESGYECNILPSLNFEFINLDELKSCLTSSQQYSGLIFTSQRSIEAIDFVQKSESVSLKSWEQLPAYCVGPATASLAKSKLKLQNILGVESGNSENLANLISQNVTPDMSPLLYPCSEIAREKIDQILSQNQINFRKLVIYQTLQSKTLYEDFVNIVSDSVDFIVFFSPSVVEFVIPLLRKNKNLLQCKLVAIGQITNEALNKLGEQAAAVSSKPEPVALLKAIQSCT